MTTSWAPPTPGVPLPPVSVPPAGEILNPVAVLLCVNCTLLPQVPAPPPQVAETVTVSPDNAALTALLAVCEAEMQEALFEGQLARLPVRAAQRICAT